MAASATINWISIHPPRAGRDRQNQVRLAKNQNFNPPAPCGAGRGGARTHDIPAHISIHPPRAGRDRPKMPMQPPISRISIHPPRAGRDNIALGTDEKDFISIHPPRAGRDDIDKKLRDLCDISIHPPRAGRDLHRDTRSSGQNRFQSTRPVRGGTWRSGRFRPECRYFNPPAPCGAGLDVSPPEIATQAISIHPPRAGRD